MPKRAWPLWLLTGMILAGFPALNFIYWPQVLRSGALPPDGDSIGIPMFASVLFTLAASPLVLGAAWICLRRYSPKTTFMAWRWDRPVRSILAALVFGGGAALLGATAAADLASHLPWYEYLWSVYLSVCALWLLCLRAAITAQRAGPAEAEIERNRPPQERS